MILVRELNPSHYTPIFRYVNQEKTPLPVLKTGKGHMLNRSFMHVSREVQPVLFSSGSFNSFNVMTNRAVLLPLFLIELRRVQSKTKLGSTEIELLFIKCP